MAVVTGASRGIGAAIARRLTRAGACVAHRLCQQRRACPAVRATDYGRLRCGRSRDHMQGGRHRRRSRCAAWCPRRSPRSADLDILVNNAFAHYSFDPRNRKTFGYDRMVRLRGTARRMPQRRIQHLRSRAAADATSDRRTHHQHLQQPRRLPHRALSRLHRGQRRIGGLHPVLGAGGGRLGRDRERHRGRAHRWHRIEPCHHRGCTRAYHRIHPAWADSPPPRTSPAPWPCSRETMPRSSRDRPCMSTAVW